MSQELKEKTDNICETCGNLVPDRAPFCPRCGPPEVPDNNIKGGISIGKTYLGIFLLLMVFITIAIFKLDIKVDRTLWVSLVGDISGSERQFPHEKDYIVIHTIRGKETQVRENPRRSSNAFAVLKKGDSIKIIKVEGEWSMIEINGKSGWIFKDDMESEIQ